MQNEEALAKMREMEEENKALNTIRTSLEKELDNAVTNNRKLQEMLDATRDEIAFLRGKVAAYEFVFTKGDM